MSVLLTHARTVVPVLMISTPTIVHVLLDMREMTVRLVSVLNILPVKYFLRVSRLFMTT